MKQLLFLFFCAFPMALSAQVGEHRSDFSIGANGGYVLSNVRFTPKVTQGYHGGMSGGLSMRYICEKYFKMIASVRAEVNYASLGWEESILDAQSQPVVNAVTGQAEAYRRTINYVQVPIMAHLAWGKERKGLNLFFSAGPQFGFCIGESTSKNFDINSANLEQRASKTIAQDTMVVENKFDYGITAGLGLEYSLPKAGHILLEGRYYYGLGNLYGDTKRDFFGSSNFGNIVIKLTYLFDIKKTKLTKK